MYFRLHLLSVALLLFSFQQTGCLVYTVLDVHPAFLLELYGSCLVPGWIHGARRDKKIQKNILEHMEVLS